MNDDEHDDEHDAWQLHHHGASWEDIGIEMGAAHDAQNALF